MSLSPEVFRPRPEAIAAGTRPAVRDQGQVSQPCAIGGTGLSRAAASSARRLFPTPPGPVKVTRRWPSPDHQVDHGGWIHARGRSAASPARARAWPAPRGGRCGRVASKRWLGGTARSSSIRRCSSGADGKSADRTRRRRSRSGPAGGQPGLAIGRRRLDVDEPGHPGREQVLVFQAGYRFPRCRPAVALPVDPDEDLALGQVSAVDLARRVRPGAQLEHHRDQPQADHGVSHGLPLGGELPRRRAGEDPDPLIGSTDHGGWLLGVGAPWWQA